LRHILEWKKDILVEEVAFFLVLAIIVASFLSIRVTSPIIDLIITVESPMTFKETIFFSLAMQMPHNKA
jgi:hypothetical protein